MRRARIARSILQLLFQFTASRISAIPADGMGRLADHIIRIKMPPAGERKHGSGQKARIAHAGKIAGSNPKKYSGGAHLPVQSGRYKVDKIINLII